METIHSMKILMKVVRMELKEFESLRNLLNIRDVPTTSLLGEEDADSRDWWQWVIKLLEKQEGIQDIDSVGLSTKNSRFSRVSTEANESWL